MAPIFPPFPQQPKKLPPIPTTRPTPPSQSHGDQGAVIFTQIKWSNEEDTLREAALPHGSFDVDFSGLKQPPTTPQLRFIYSESNYQQGTKISGGSGGVLVIKNNSAGWRSAPVPFVNKFTVQGVAYTPGESENVGVLLSAWAYTGGLLLLMQWDDVGWNGPDYDYNDDEQFLWLPVSPQRPFDVQRDPRRLTLQVIPI